MTDWIARPLADIARALRGGEVTATDLLARAAACHARWDGDLHAYKHWDETWSRTQARAADAAFAAGIDTGPLQGIPVAFKDLYGVRGLPIFAGTPRQLPPEWEAEGALVRANRGQLAVVMGKTHTVEFAFGGLGTNAHWGTPRNPWDARVHRVPGGSSSGSGVALVEGSAVIAYGTDTAGSVRAPASLTGNAGYKPTGGRWPLDGIVPLSPTFDSPGILARTSADMAYAFCALDPACRGRAGTAALGAVDIAGLGIGVTDAFFWDDCSPGIAEAVEAALGELSAHGAGRRAVVVPGMAEAYGEFREGGLAAPELVAMLRSRLPEWMETLDPAVSWRMDNAHDMPAHEFLARAERFRDLAAAADAVFESVDVVASPTVPITPPAVAEVSELAAYGRNAMVVVRNTSIANLLGFSAVTIPVGLDAAGLPVGLQLMARGGADERLVATAVAVEKVLGTSAERLGRPPLGGA